ncbi:MAG TPA: hypothetical protein VK139_01010 [Microbacteriaceae bacterium]|nr:hypothetical protein [Microbacteriaceae bacterium]
MKTTFSGRKLIAVLAASIISVAGVSAVAFATPATINSVSFSQDTVADGESATLTFNEDPTFNSTDWTGCYVQVYAPYGALIQMSDYTNGTSSYYTNDYFTGWGDLIPLSTIASGTTVSNADLSGDLSEDEGVTIEFYNGVTCDSIYFDVYFREATPDATATITISNPVTISADQTTMSDGDELNVTTNGSYDQLVAVFIDGYFAEMDMGNYFTELGWQYFACNRDVVATFRVYDQSWYDAMDADYTPSFDDPYLDSVDVTFTSAGEGLCIGDAPGEPENADVRWVTDTTATLFWEFPELLNYNDYQFQVYLDGTYVNDTWVDRFSVANLTPDTDYVLSVEATNANGDLVSERIDVPFHTLAAPVGVVRTFHIDCSLVDDYGNYTIATKPGERVKLVFDANCDGIGDLLGGSGNGTNFDFVSSNDQYGSREVSPSSNWLFYDVETGFELVGDIMQSTDSTGDIADGNYLMFFNQSPRNNLSINWVLAPDSVTDLAADNITDSSATLNWTPVDGATEYNVYVDGDLVGTASDASFDLTGLDPETVYAVSVETVDENGTSLPATGELTTLAASATSAVALASTGSNGGWMLPALALVLLGGIGAILARRFKLA